MAMADSTLTTRNASLAELASLLEDQHTRKLDVVTAATKLTAVGGNLVLAGAGEPLLTPEGVTATDVALRPTRLGRRQPRGQARYPDQVHRPVCQPRNAADGRRPNVRAVPAPLLERRHVRRPSGSRRPGLA
jgi:hypothetical protein